MISIIIPTYNEQANIGKTIDRLKGSRDAHLIKEIIVADGRSSDNTLEEAERAGAIGYDCPQKGRSTQMNFGAAKASGTLLYFLHADTIPPLSFVSDIISAWERNYTSGCFMLSFDHDHWFLKANCWFTRFDVNAIRFGDQSLFVARDQFHKIGGFCENHIVMEDQEIIKRLKKEGRFTVIKKPVRTSARKYIDNGIYKTQGIFFLIYFMYYLGYSQQALVSTYRKLFRQNKV